MIDMAREEKTKGLAYILKLSILLLRGEHKAGRPTVPIISLCSSAFEKYLP